MTKTWESDLVARQDRANRYLAEKAYRDRENTNACIRFILLLSSLVAGMAFILFLTYILVNG